LGGKGSRRNFESTINTTGKKHNKKQKDGSLICDTAQEANHRNQKRRHKHVTNALNMDKMGID